jgi:hypothetical protein
MFIHEISYWLKVTLIPNILVLTRSTLGFPTIIIKVFISVGSFSPVFALFWNCLHRLLLRTLEQVVKLVYRFLLQILFLNIYFAMLYH